MTLIDFRNSNRTELIPTGVKNYSYKHFIDPLFGGTKLLLYMGAFVKAGNFTCIREQNIGTPLDENEILLTAMLWAHEIES